MMLAERADGRFAARQVGLIVPRQNGKGSVLEALELYHLFVIETCRLVIHSAHEFATSAEHFLRLLSLVEGTPDLDRKVHRVHKAHGSEGIELRDGSRIQFKTRTGGGGRGFSGDLVVFDEAYNLPDKAISSLIPTMSARVNPQLVVTSSAPLDDPVSDVLRRFCKRGRRGSPGLAYIEYCAAPDAMPDDDGQIGKANPSYPHRIDPEAVDAERLMMTREDFLRERLGLWNEDLEEAERVIPTRRWVACLDPQSLPGGSVTFALDVSPDRAWSSFVVASGRPDGRCHLEVVDRLPGTDGAPTRARQLCDRWGGEVVIAKGSPAASLESELTRAGVPIRWVATEEHAQACGNFYDAVIAGTLAHLGDTDLDRAVEGAATRTYNDAWLWSRRKAGVDISPLVGATLARWVALHPPEPVEPPKPLYAY